MNSDVQDYIDGVREELEKGVEIVRKGAVLHAQAQDLITSGKAQARANIGAHDVQVSDDTLMFL